MFIDPNELTDAERNKKIQVLKLKQISFDSDLRKAIRKRENLDFEIKDLKKKWDLIQAQMIDLNNQKKKLDNDILFLEDEMKQTKRQLLNLK